MHHPFFSLSPKQHKRLFWFFLALTVLATAVLQHIDASLQTAASPQGIVSYELAGTATKAAAILASWDANAQLHAGFSLGFDFLYMLAYTVTLALALVWLVQPYSGFVSSLGAATAWAMGIAGLSDALENYFLWQILISGPTDSDAMIARGAALLKFALIIFAFLYIIFLLLYAVFRRLRQEKAGR